MAEKPIYSIDKEPITENFGEFRGVISLYTSILAKKIEDVMKKLW
ncbi:hypothetical protein [Neobacillus cucumis]|nr:hypothetical protein [Neobacillus cucumis]